MLRFLVRTLCGGMLAVSLAATPGFAQQPSAASVQLARELIESNGSLRAVDEMIPGMLDRVRGMMTSTNPDLSAAIGEVTTSLRGEFQAQRAEVVTNIAQVYATRFTEAELRDLVAFYKSAIGKKFVSTLPIVLQESFGKIEEWSNKLGEQMVARVRAEMRKKGHEL